MITKEQARSLRHGEVVHAGECHKHVGPRGAVRFHITRLRVSGRLLEWKRSPERWELPIKYGLRDSYRLSNKNAHEFHLESECKVLFPKGASE